MFGEVSIVEASVVETSIVEAVLFFGKNPLHLLATNPYCRNLNVLLH